MQNENSSTETLTRNPWHLRKTVFRWPQLGNTKTRGVKSEVELVPPPWYTALWRIVTIALMQTACGIALGVVMLVIAHYVGIDA